MKRCRPDTVYLFQLLLSVFLPAPLVPRALSKLSEPLSFLLGRVDLAPQLLLHFDLLHLDAALLLLSFLQPESKHNNNF